MEDLTNTISRLVTLLEDAIEETNWELVTTVSEELDELYSELDRNDYVNNY